MKPRYNILKVVLMFVVAVELSLHFIGLCSRIVAYLPVFCLKQVRSIIHSRSYLPCMDVGSLQVSFYLTGNVTQ